MDVSADQNLIGEALVRAGFDAEISNWGQTRIGVRGLSATCRVAASDHGPLDLFVKLNQTDPDCFEREREAAICMSVREARHLPVPKLVFQNGVERVIVWEDIGSHTPLGDVLLASPRLEVETALRRLARALSKVHRWTPPHSPWPAALKTRVCTEAAALRTGVPRIADLHSAMGGGELLHLETVVADLAADHESDCAAVGLTHGDQAPSNVVYVDDEAVLLDFEYAAIRPVLYDLATWAVICPLPQALLKGLLEAYREALIGSRLDQLVAEFELRWARACAFRVLTLLTWFGPALAETNGLWGDSSDRRSILILALRHTVTAMRGNKGQSKLADTMEGLLETAEKIWVVQPHELNHE